MALWVDAARPRPPPFMHAAVGAYLPIYPIHGCVVSVPLRPPASPPAVCVVDDARKLYVAPLHGGVRMSGMADLRGSAAPVVVDAARARRLLNQVGPVRQRWIAGMRDTLSPSRPPQADALMPGALDLSAASLHACARPVSADDVPIIGRLDAAPPAAAPLLLLLSLQRPPALAIPSNVFVNAGHGSKGWTLAAGSAKLLASLLCGGEGPRGLVASDYSPARFVPSLK